MYIHRGVVDRRERGLWTESAREEDPDHTWVLAAWARRRHRALIRPALGPPAMAARPRRGFLRSRSQSCRAELTMPRKGAGRAMEDSAGPSYAHEWTGGGPPNAESTLAPPLKHPCASVAMRASHTSLTGESRSGREGGAPTMWRSRRPVDLEKKPLWEKKGELTSAKRSQRGGEWAGRPGERGAGRRGGARERR